MSSHDVTSESRPLRKANDWIDPKGLRAPAELFDDFWREGELAMLFGAAGVGKSLLAVQIGEALARGRPVAGFGMPGSGRNVLYVDLVLSDEQWAMRYSRETRPTSRRAYKFSARLYRDRPLEGESLIAWLRTYLTDEKIRVVIIDDLSVISQSNDGTRETLGLMRSLRQMTREMGVSVLVLADSLPLVFQRKIAERDLRRTRVLCAFADTVFAIEAPSDSDRRYLVQTRAQAGEPVWTHRSPARIVLTAREDGFVGFEREKMSPDQRDLVLRIKEMHDCGHSFRAIADELEISKSTAARLHAKWTPLLLEPPTPLLREEGWQRFADGVVGAGDPLSEPPASAGGQFPGNEDAAFDPTQRRDYFPGCEEYDEASIDPKFDREFMDEDDEEYDPYEQSLLAREGYLIELARADAHRAYDETGIVPRLADHPKYKAFIECVACGGDPWAGDLVGLSDNVSVPPAVAGGLSQAAFEPSGQDAGVLDVAESNVQPPATAGGTDPATAGGTDPATAGGTDAATAGGTDLVELPRALDDYGREIFIEKEDERGQPVVWYKFDKRGTKFRHERRQDTILITEARV